MMTQWKEKYMADEDEETSACILLILEQLQGVWKAHTTLKTAVEVSEFQNDRDNKRDE